MNKKINETSKKPITKLFEKLIWAVIFLLIGGAVISYTYDFVTRPKAISIAEVDGNITYFVWDPPQDSNRFAPKNAFISVVDPESERLIILDLQDIEPFPYFLMGWSPDGKRLALTEFGDCLYIVEETGSTCLVEAGIFSSWSPDGKRISFSTLSQNQENSTLYYINLATSTQTEIINVPSTTYVGSTWSPNGKQLVYEAPEETDTWYLWVYSVQSAQSHLLTQGQNPAWSSDGKGIAFTRNGQLWLYNLSDSREELLVDNFFVITQPVWSPDNSTLLFVARQNNEGTNTDIYLIHRDGSGLHNLSNQPGQAYSPTWHPGFSD